MLSIVESHFMNWICSWKIQWNLIFEPKMRYVKWSLIWRPQKFHYPFVLVLFLFDVRDLLDSFLLCHILMAEEKQETLSKQRKNEVCGSMMHLFHGFAYDRCPKTHLWLWYCLYTTWFNVNSKLHNRLNMQLLIILEILVSMGAIQAKINWLKQLNISSKTQSECLSRVLGSSQCLFILDTVNPYFSSTLHG